MSLVAPFTRKLRQAGRDARLKRWYGKYRSSTLLPEQAYIENLDLVLPLADDRDYADAAVVECGVWRGGMSAGLIEVFGPNRPYAFFDSFVGLPPAQEIDGPAARRWQSQPDAPAYHDNCRASRAEFERTLSQLDQRPRNVSVFEGLFEETVVASGLGRIVVLRLDADWYASTMLCLEAFWDRVVPGGVVILDDYGVWDGCTRATHDFLAKRSAAEAVERFGGSSVPFLRKRPG